MAKDGVDLVQITLEFSSKKRALIDDSKDDSKEERLQLVYFPHNPSASHVYNYNSSTKILMKDFKELTNFFDSVANASDEILKILGNLGGSK